MPPWSLWTEGGGPECTPPPKVRVNWRGTSMVAVPKDSEPLILNPRVGAPQRRHLGTSPQKASPRKSAQAPVPVPPARPRTQDTVWGTASRVSTLASLRDLLAHSGENHPKLREHQRRLCQHKKCTLCQANETLDMFDYRLAGGDEPTYAHIRSTTYKREQRPAERLQKRIRNLMGMGGATSTWQAAVPEEEEPEDALPPVMFVRTPTPTADQPDHSHSLTAEMLRAHARRRQAHQDSWDAGQVAKENRAVHKALKLDIRHREADKPSIRGMYVPPPPPDTQNDFMLALLKLQRLEQHPALPFLTSEHPSKLRSAAFQLKNITMEPSARDRYPADKVGRTEFEELFRRVYPSVGTEDLETLAMMFDRDQDAKVPLWDALLVFNHIWHAMVEREPLALMHFYADLVHWDVLQCKARRESHGPFVHYTDLRLLCSTLADTLEGTTLMEAITAKIFTLKVDKQGQIVAKQFQDAIAADPMLAAAFAPSGVTAIQTEWRDVRRNQHQAGGRQAEEESAASSSRSSSRTE